MDSQSISRNEHEPLQSLAARSTYEPSSPLEPAAGSSVSSLTPDDDTDGLSAHHDFELHAPSVSSQTAHDIEHEETRQHPEKITASARELLLKKLNPATSHRQAQPGGWGVSWYYPSYMVLWWLAGFAFALGHHFYYMSLDGAAAGSASRQGWAVRFGTAFAFLVVTCLRASSEIAYKQYIWTLCKRKAFELDALDKLFSATSDPTALSSRIWLKHAKLAFFVILICWCTALAGITPPATLSVTTGFVNETRSTPLRSFDWTSPNFFDWASGTPQPSAETMRLAYLSANSMAVVPPDPPGLNTSYQVQFFGPSVQCSYANSSQQAIFDAYSRALAFEVPLSMTLTKSVWEAGNLTWGYKNATGTALMSVYSAFSPYSGYYGWAELGAWISHPVVRFLEPPWLDYSIDAYNNWVTPFYPNMTNIHLIPNISNRMPFVNQQLWVQLADRAMVCVMGNASFDVGYEFVEGTQTVAEYHLSDFEPFWTPQSGFFEGFDNKSGIYDSFNSYMSVYLALSGLINGNVSTTFYFGDTVHSLGGNVTFGDASSRVLQNGLSACREFTNGYWSGDNVIGSGEQGPVYWRDAESEIGVASSQFSKIDNELFTKPPWMCRNRTIIRAIEDLANNITISMLSSVNLTTPNATTADVLYFTTHNVYHYDSRNLIISYSVALLLTLLCVCVGFFALHFNGVVHSVSFSAFVATTRNPELDALVSGQSLAAMPLKYPETKLRFGELSGPAGRASGDGDEKVTGRHIGFGTVESVTTLRRGQPYT